MERVSERSNLQAALKRVRKNGSPGIDGMTVDELPGYLRTHWPGLREQMLAGTYQPAAVKEQLIPKGNGEMRKLGIPTVLDRFIQQAYRELRARGLSEHGARRVASNGRRWWKNSAQLINVAFPISYFDSLGVPRLAA